MADPQLIKIPAGEFLMGSLREEIEDLLKRFEGIEGELLEREIPQHKVYLNKYYIGKYPVTNKEFTLFVEQTKYITTVEKEGSGAIFTPKFSEVKDANWRHPFGPGSSISEKDKHPVVQVSWYDAIAYCRWLSKKDGRRFRLPTEAEWEKAARGVDGRTFPWGNDWNPTICNVEYRIKDTTPVGKFSPESDSPYGCSDMCGNVFEWTSTTTGSSKPWPSKFKYPYKKNDGRENLKLKTRRIGRGGSYSRNELFCRAAFRFADPPSDRYSAQGFRIALDSH